MAALCDRAAYIASERTEVPLEVLRAISLAETGVKKAGKVGPWPWTVNMEGHGQWFDDRRTALAHVDRHLSQGARNFDIGCFQINYHWHNAAFTSIEEMFDPLSNATYAAEFLRSLYKEFGDWTVAAGAFHSRTPKHAKKYIARFKRIRDSLEKSPEQTMRPTVLVANNLPSARNSYPLLHPNAGPKGIGSLVPLRGYSDSGRFIAIEGR